MHADIIQENNLVRELSPI